MAPKKGLAQPSWSQTFDNSLIRTNLTFLNQMASSYQDILKKMEEMMTRMTAPIIERLHHLKGTRGKKKKVVQEPQDKDSIFDDDCLEEKEAEINKKPKKKE
nr:hypothetical protein CFP56_66326 [Quercus suber]